MSSTCFRFTTNATNDDDMQKSQTQVEELLLIF